METCNVCIAKITIDETLFALLFRWARVQPREKKQFDPHKL